MRVGFSIMHTQQHRRRSSVLLLLLLLLLLRVMKAAQSMPPSPAVFVFGDSILDVGNNNYLPFSLAKANFRPYGVDFRNRAPTGRFSNGRNTADIFVQLLGLPSPLPYLSPSTSGKTILNGVNYASGGAGILNETGSSIIQRVPLSKQLLYFERTSTSITEQLGSDGARNLISDALFLVSVGSNDCLRYFLFRSTSPTKLTTEYFVKLLVSILRQQLQKLYNLGARRLVFLGVGPIGCIPSQLSEKSKGGECIEELNSMAVKLNGAMKMLLIEMSAALPSFHYSFANVYDLALDMINDPRAYGFEDAKKACCGEGRFNGELQCTPLTPFCSNRSSHVFWDRFHPTEAFQELLAGIFFSGTPQQISPMNIQQLVGT